MHWLQVQWKINRMTTSKLALKLTQHGQSLKDFRWLHRVAKNKLTNETEQKKKKQQLDRFWLFSLDVLFTQSRDVNKRLETYLSPLLF